MTLKEIVKQGVEVLKVFVIAVAVVIAAGCALFGAVLILAIVLATFLGSGPAVVIALVVVAVAAVVTIGWFVENH